MDWYTVFTNENEDFSVLLGMAGILLDKCFEPREVVITDLASHVPLIDRNILSNSATRCRGSDYDWLQPPDIGQFDIVLGFEWFV